MSVPSESNSSDRLYQPGHRPRCQCCLQELKPCPVLDSGYPQRIRYAGFYPCPQHPRSGVLYAPE